MGTAAPARLELAPTGRSAICLSDLVGAVSSVCAIGLVVLSGIEFARVGFA